MRGSLADIIRGISLQITPNEPQRKKPDNKSRSLLFACFVLVICVSVALFFEACNSFKVCRS